MRVTKIGPPAPTFRKALGYDPGLPDDDVEVPEFEGARVFVPVGSENVWTPAPNVTDSDDATYAETSEHDEAMRVALDFPVRFSGAIVKVAVETAGDRTYTFEGATLPDFSDAVELVEVTFAGVADWEVVEVEFDYPSPTVGHQYYRFIGPDEVRRWHNLRLLEDTHDGCECIEFCRDPEPAELGDSNTSGTLTQADPITLGGVPSVGSLWLIACQEFPIAGFTEIAGPLQAGSTITSALYAREVQSGDTGSVTNGSPFHFITAAFTGVDPQFDAIEELDDQTTGGAATCEVPITVPAGDHLVVVYINHDNTLVPTEEAGWTLVETQTYATTKYQAMAYAFTTGGALTPGIAVTAGGNWFGFAASFPVIDQGEAIVGGPSATAGDGTKASPCTHHHDYVAAGGSTGEVLAKASGADWDTEWVAAGGGLPATILDAKGDLITATAADTPVRLAVGANDTILMADSAQTTGLKYVGSQTPTTLDYDDVAAQGTADTYARGDHVHGMPAAAAPADDSHVWMPLTTVDGGEPVLVWDGDDSLIPTLVPV